MNTHQRFWRAICYHYTKNPMHMTYSNSLKVTNISYRSHTFRAILWENLLLSSGRELDIHLTAVALSFSTIRNRVIPSYRQFSWLGWYGSDVRYTGQSRGPLPLGYTPLILLILVLGAGFEPATFRSRIFLLLYVTIATFLCCSLDYVFTIAFALGGWYIVSTRL